MSPYRRYSASMSSSTASLRGAAVTGPTASWSSTSTRSARASGRAVTDPPADGHRPGRGPLLASADPLAHRDALVLDGLLGRRGAAGARSPPGTRTTRPINTSPLPSTTTNTNTPNTGPNHPGMENSRGAAGRGWPVSALRMSGTVGLLDGGADRHLRRLLAPPGLRGAACRTSTSSRPAPVPVEDEYPRLRSFTVNVGPPDFWGITRRGWEGPRHAPCYTVPSRQARSGDVVVGGDGGGAGVVRGGVQGWRSGTRPRCGSSPRPRGGSSGRWRAAGAPRCRSPRT
jgi:hypothetical protein